MINKKLRYYFDAYEGFHKSKENKLIHYVCVPLIVFSVLGLIGEVSIIPGIETGILLIALSAIFYFYVDWKLSIPYLLVIFGVHWLSRIPNPMTLLAIFVLSWAFQFWGHYYYEKKSPALLTNLLHLLVAPLWIFARLVRYGG